MTTFVTLVNKIMGSSGRIIHGCQIWRIYWLHYSNLWVGIDVNLINFTFVPNAIFGIKLTIFSSQLFDRTECLNFGKIIQINWLFKLAWLMPITAKNIRCMSQVKLTATQAAFSKRSRMYWFKIKASIIDVMCMAGGVEGSNQTQ